MREYLLVFKNRASGEYPGPELFQINLRKVARDFDTATKLGREAIQKIVMPETLAELDLVSCAPYPEAD